MEPYIIIALISMLFFAVNTFILKLSPKIDSVSLSLISVSTAAVCIFMYWLIFNTKKEITMQGAGYAVLSGAVYTVALILFVVALRMGKASVVSTINALSAGVLLILVVAFLSEKITAIQWAGIILGIIAAVLLSL